MSDYEIVIVDVKQKLDFASAEYLKEKVLEFVNRNKTEGRQLVVINGQEINCIDYTVAMVSIFIINYIQIFFMY